GIVVQEQSGAITILNGMIVSPDLVEADSNDSATAGARGFATEATTIKPRGIAAEDQVIADDLIVQGSICTGFDCVNNESFGFDTLRLKENNLRIHFDDTSASAGFPATDWRIIANDSASGGANYLSVEDSSAVTTPFKIEGASPTNSLFVDSTGRIGFRNSAPVLDLHLTDTDTPALRLEQSNAGGFTAQTWDVAGNEANFFVRDVTGGSLLSFRIRPGAPTSSLDISSDGDIGMGTASPNANTSLDVSDATQVKAKIALTGQEFYQASNTDTEGVALVLGVNRSLNRQLWIADTSALTQNATNQAIRIYPNAGEISATATNGNTTKTLSLNGLGGNVGVATFSSAFPFQVGDAGAGDGNGAHVTTGGVWTNGSSRSFKNNIAELSAEEAMAAVAALKPVRYNYLSEPNEQYVGFIAEDVPELVAQTSEDRKYLSPMDIVATLTKVVQEQQKTIDELSKKVNELEKNH
ncbi:MAG TPA: tail fiber domain-containing protein, partial [Thermoanaerobaculia bacterium]|nr:tail fiber domain-containing protein [Thermoanaerobaculia bacterium]